jgi:hypothetical protein
MGGAREKREVKIVPQRSRTSLIPDDLSSREYGRYDVCWLVVE